MKSSLFNKSPVPADCNRKRDYIGAMHDSAADATKYGSVDLSVRPQLKEMHKQKEPSHSRTRQVNKCILQLCLSSIIIVIVLLFRKEFESRHEMNLKVSFRNVRSTIWYEIFGFAYESDILIERKRALIWGLDARKLCGRFGRSDYAWNSLCKLAFSLFSFAKTRRRSGCTSRLGPHLSHSLSVGSRVC
jgi:hypothetical protein